MKRSVASWVALILTVAIAFSLTACGFSSGNEKAIVASVEKAEATMVVIKVETAEEKTTLIDVMEYLQKENELAFQVIDGMIIEINGKANDVDYDPCWMLYTSDAEMSNTAWGTFEYNGQTLGGAIVGAGALPVIDGGVYVWSYQGFNA